MVDEKTRQEIAFEARLDERDEIVAHLKAVAGFMRATGLEMRKLSIRRWVQLGSAKAIEFAADQIAMRHRTHGL